MTVDEILASGRYTDRRGRHWDHYRNADTWTHFPSGRRLTRAQMRLLIERDQHRDECRGLHHCADHPVPLVLVFKFDQDRYVVYRPHEYDGEVDQFPTFPEAMDAARALAVGP